MALTFGAVSTDRVDHGSDASIDNLDPFTMMMWCNISTLVNTRYLFGKGLVKRSWLAGTGGNITLRVATAGSDLIYTTDDTPLSVDKWHFIAITANSSGGAGETANIYVGDLTTLAVESTYGTAVDGGAFDSDAAETMQFGNQSASSVNALLGDIAVVAYVGAELSLAQIRSWQFRPRKLASMVIYSHYGFNGTGAQADWSGKGNSGTVTGVTVAGHVPLGPPFAFDLGWEGISVATVVPSPFAVVKTHYRPFVTHRLEGYHVAPPQTLVSIEDKSVSRRRGDSFKTERASECFQAHDSVGEEIFPDVTPINLNLDVEDLNSDSALFLLSDNVVTVSVAGMYFITYFVGGESGAAKRTASTFVRKNASTVDGTTSSFTTTGVFREVFNMSATRLISLAKDDKISIGILSPGAADRPITLPNQSGISIIGPIRP